MGIAMRRGPRALAALAALALLTILLGGCASTPSAAQPGATQTLTWAAPPTATPSPTPPPTRSFQQAWGNTSVTRLPTGLSSNQYIFQFANAATPDGQWLVGDVEPRSLSDSSGFTPYLAAYNVHTRQIARIHDLATTRSGVSMVATDGAWFVWQELTIPSVGSIGVADGVVRVANWKTGAYRQYTQAMLMSLVVETGKALWSQITPNEQSASAAAQTAIVRLADLNAGTVTTLASNATGAALAWPWAGWGVQTDTIGGGYLQFKNLMTGQTTQSAPVVGQTIQALAGTLALHGVTAVVAQYYSSEIDVIPDVSQSATPQMLFDNTKPGLGPVSTSGRLAAWDGVGASIPLVWDSVQRALVTLPATTSSPINEAWTGGRLLVWYASTETTAQQQADEAAGLQTLGALCVVDTATLPTTPTA